MHKINNMNIIIAGTRTFNNFNYLDKVVTDILKDITIKNEDITIFSGGARGTDRLGEIYAELNNLKLKIFKADWNKYGKYAGPKRNAEMAKEGDILIAFWDEESKGTKNMIDEANKKDLKIYIYNYK